MSWKGFKDIQATIIIDLEKSEEKLWNNLKKDAQRYLKKALKNNLKFEESKNWDEFYPIYKEVAMKGEIIPLPLKTLKEQDLRLLVTKYNGKIIGGVVINFNNGIPNMMINAIDPKYYHTYSGYFVYWNMILWAKRQGHKKLDLGGYQLKAKGKLEDINSFKEKWGGEIKEYYVYDKNPFYILGRKTIRNIGTVKKIRDKIRISRYKGKRISLKRLFQKFIYDKRTMIIFENNLKKHRKIEPKINVELKKIDLDELKDYTHSIPKRIINQIEGKNECFVFVDKGKITHLSRIRYDKMYLPEVNFEKQLEDREACIFDCYTDKNYWGLKLYSSMLCKIQDYLKQKGFEKCYIYCDSRNDKSIRGIKKTGFKKYQIIDYLNFFGVKNEK